MTITWQKLLLPPNEIDLNTLLRCGQAFRWRKINNVWSCALNNQILLLRETDQDDTHILEYTTLDELSSKHIETLEYELRGLGFGYRAKYISKTVRLMIENPEFWETLNNDNSWSEDGDEKCIEFLRQFPGVGPKVADCVALMGCKRHDLVPVDTHVWNILRSTYRKEFEKWVDSLSIKEEEGEDGAKKLTTKDKARTSEIPKSSLKRSLSNKAVDVKIYPFVKRFFREYWGVKAGWAQSVVFSEMVKLDNGINDVEEYEKLLDKVRSFKGDGFKRRKI
ncbi:N-glycosylase/DNA lyase [Pichia kudriavzevii]|uniref:DNA-(apurinic or apyrimidinic site) lyase n=1 Tax=Pichia kudriavzevii TaxID=4909 RepID=A0A1V2LT02_PICKU|nr:N-glycosylase/DNA lyase [Pichia kudriavzevii]